MTFIIGTETGFPEHYYPQEVLANALKKYFLVSGLDFDLDNIDRFFTNVMIKGRYFMLPLDSFYEPPGIEESLKLTIEASLNLLERAIWKLLKKTGLKPQDISQLTSVSLIPAVPALDVRLMNRIPFSPHIKRMPLNGLGCLGGAFSITRVAEYLQTYPQEAAILFAIDAASLLWQGSLQRSLSLMIEQLPQDSSQYSNIIMTLITAALFGDGAVSVLMVGDEHPLARQSAGLKVIDSRSLLVPNTVNLMGTEISDTGFKEILRPEVSDFVKTSLKKAVVCFLDQHSISLDQIYYWLVHSGGPKILQIIEEEFNLDKECLNLSKQVLTEVGNISSPTVLYVLEKALLQESVPRGSYGLMIAMGPGFCLELVILQWQ